MDFVVPRTAGSLSAIEIEGDTATGLDELQYQGTTVPCVRHFKRVGGSWCVDLTPQDEQPVVPPARRSDDTADIPDVPTRLTITVAETNLSINETEVTLPAVREDLFELLGKPTRESRLANTLLTWDELGLIAYEKPETREIRAISVVLGRRPHEFWPKELFAGTLIVDGAVVSAQSTVEEINGNKTGRRFHRNRLSTDSWVIRREGARVDLVEAHPDFKSETAVLSYVQIGVAGE
jgi:hypothetical protein